MERMRSFKKIIYGLLFMGFMHSAQGATIPVGPPPNSIQAAVDLANNGDTVLLSAGTYVGQQVQVINKSINIVGAGENVSIIEAPGPATRLSQSFSYMGITWWCVVMIDNQAAPAPQTVNISNLTVDGDSQQD